MITNYLLEKARVVKQAEQERNYHIFYHLLNGAPQELLLSLGVSGVTVDKYRYLSYGRDSQLDCLPDVQLFQEIQRSFDTMGFP